MDRAAWCGAHNYLCRFAVEQTWVRGKPVAFKAWKEELEQPHGRQLLNSGWLVWRKALAVVRTRALAMARRLEDGYRSKYSGIEYAP